MITPAGKRRSLITIQTRDSGNDAMGAPLNTWSNWNQVWARVVSTGGSEEFKGQQYSPEVTHQVFLQFLAGITPMMRVVTPDGQILDILFANYGERKLDDVILQCKERLTDSGSLNVG